MALFIVGCGVFAARQAIAQDAPAAAALTGTLRGTVLDGSTGDPIVHATVQLIGTKLGALTNTHGTYSVKNIPPGTYSVKISYVGYTVRTVVGVEIIGGATTRQDASLAIQASRQDTVVISARASRLSEGAALTERRRASTVSDAISADQIAKAPAGDAGEAMKRVTGVSVVGSKFVVVRGLSERYNATQLNGVNLPSPEPEKKVVPFDLFPSNMIGRMTTVKTFTPDNPGDFVGGLVKITTREFPEAFLFSLSAASGLNSEARGPGAVGYAGGGTDYLGIDDGTRGLPAGIRAERLSSADDQAALLSRFNNNVWLPSPTTLPVNQSYSLSLGNQYDIGFPLGFLLSGSYAANSALRSMSQAYPLLELDNGRRSLRYDYQAHTANRSTLWGGLVNISAQPSPDQKVSFKFVYNHSSDDETNLVTGLYNQSAREDIRYTRLRFLERSVMSLQLDGEHQLPWLLDSRLEWRGAISTAKRYEPDNRSTTYLLSEDGTYRFANNFGTGNSRFFSDLNDGENTAGLDWTIPIGTFNGATARVKTGGLLRFRNRDFDANRFLYSANTSDAGVLALSPEKLFTAENVRAGLIGFNNLTESTDNYTASETITAGYAMVDLAIAPSLRLVAGLRAERWSAELTTIDRLTGGQDSALAVNRDHTDVLPSVNLIYSLSEAMNLRAAFSQTLARPEFRELAPFRFDDYRQSNYGNPSLDRTLVLNYDLRWEWFPTAGAVVAASGYYKSFTNPIEQIYLVGGSGISVEPANASRAMVVGGELEFRRTLDFITPELYGFSIGSNLTFVQSEVRFDAGDTLIAFDGVAPIKYSSATLTDTTSARPLQGQSPYVVNLSLGYDNDDWGTGITMLYNVFGRRLAIVGSSGIPDTYEQPRNSLDLTLTQRLGAGLQLKLTARNLLDEQTLLQQEFPDGEKIAIEQYRTGRTVSLGISFGIDGASGSR